MKTRAKLLIAPVALAFGFAAVATTPAFAQTDEQSFTATLEALNGSGGSGSYTLMMSGNEATVTGEFSGLAETFDGNPYPHVQHIHIGEEGTCPTADADSDGDGVVNTADGIPFYGEIGTTLTVSGPTGPGAALDLTVAPTGSSFSYERTFELNDATMEALESGTGVIVVHGLDPETLSEEAQAAMSELAPDLPLAATAPALCGALQPMPAGGADTGAGGSSNGPDLGLLALGGGLLLAAGGALAVRRRTAAA